MVDFRGELCRKSKWVAAAMGNNENSQQLAYGASVSVNCQLVLTLPFDAIFSMGIDLVFLNLPYQCHPLVVIFHE
jgi:hypothetical protein